MIPALLQKLLHCIKIFSLWPVNLALDAFVATRKIADSSWLMCFSLFSSSQTRSDSAGELFASLDFCRLVSCHFSSIYIMYNECRLGHARVPCSRKLPTSMQLHDKYWERWLYVAVKHLHTFSPWSGLNWKNIWDPGNGTMDALHVGPNVNHLSTEARLLLHQYAKWGAFLPLCFKFRVITFLEFLETWKCRGIWLRSGKRPKVRERSGNLCSWGNLIVSVQQNNLDVLYLYRISFLIRDVHQEFASSVGPQPLSFILQIS